MVPGVHPVDGEDSYVEPGPSPFTYHTFLSQPEVW